MVDTELRSVVHVKALFSQFSRFFFTGGVSALLQFAILIALVEAFSVSATVASSCGYAGGALLNYLLNRRFTFRSTLSHKRALLRFTLNSVFGLWINLFAIAHLLAYYSYVRSQVLASAVVLLWNFTIHRYWIFRAQA